MHQKLEFSLFSLFEPSGLVALASFDADLIYFLEINPNGAFKMITAVNFCIEYKIRRIIIYRKSTF